MELSIAQQELEAIISLLTGFGAGMLYDFLGVIRRRLKKAVFSYIFDLLFCIAVGCIFFIVGYGPGGGKLRLFMLVFIVIGCILYFILLSRIFGKLLSSLADFFVFLIRCLLMPFIWFVRLLKKTTKIIKNIFIYLSKWFIIYNRVFIPLRKWEKSAGRRKEAHHEEQKSEYNYEAGSSDFNGIRYGDFDKTEHNDKRGRSGNGGNRKSGRRKERVHIGASIRN